jgi:hypothetical protein
MNNYLKLSIILLVVAIAFSSSGIVNAEINHRPQIIAWAGIDLSNASIGGIKYRMSERQVLRKLGHPRARKMAINCLGSIERLQYQGLVIDLEQDGEEKYVTWIEVTVPHYRTDRGVKVGDSIERVLTAYAPAAKLWSDNNTTKVTIRDRKYGDLFLVFKSNNRHKIVSISVVFEC